MNLQFGQDLVPSSFVGSVAGISIAGPSFWIGEMSIAGVVPPGSTVTEGSKPYAF